MKRTFESKKNEYRYRKETTQENLEMQVTAGDGIVAKYGDHILMADRYWNGGFIAGIYEFVETPEETGPLRMRVPPEPYRDIGRHFPGRRPRPGMGDQPDEINEMGSGAEAQVPAAFPLPYRINSPISLKRDCVSYPLAIYEHRR